MSFTVDDGRGRWGHVLSSTAVSRVHLNESYSVHSFGIDVLVRLAKSSDLKTIESS